jgi:hypothetical protein
MILISLSAEICVFSCSVPPSSHLTSCTLTKSNLYLVSSLETVIKEPALYKLLTFHNPNLISILRSLGRLCKESVQARGSFRIFVTNLLFMVKAFLPHSQPQSWGTTPFRLSAVDYSIYSQLPSIARGRSSIRNPRTRHSVLTLTHLTWSSHSLITLNCM